MKREKVELLAPAGNVEAFYGAIHAGADAVYLGGEKFGARAYADNFTTQQLVECIRYAHIFGRRVYLTVNTLVKEKEWSELYEYIFPFYEAGLDGVIIQDLGVFLYLKENFPDMELHISTQANNTNYGTYRFWHAQGAKRVVTARELSLEEIKEIRANIPEDLEIETFIHGAMCISYSGRCLLSSFLAGRDANQGACTHPCRWKYYLMEENRPGEYMPVYENERGTYIFNSKDLCMIEYIPEIIDAGIDSLKIEGRMKTALYVATVARTYRKAIDDYFISEETYRANMGWYQEEISKCTYRQFTTGFYFGKPDENTQIYDSNTYVNEYIYLGIVEEVDRRGFVKIEQRNKFSKGDVIEIMKPDGRNIEVTVQHLYDEDGNEVESAPHPKQILYLDLTECAEKYDLLRVKSN